MEINVNKTVSTPPFLKEFQEAANALDASLVRLLDAARVPVNEAGSKNERELTLKIDNERYEIIQRTENGAQVRELAYWPQSGVPYIDKFEISRGASGLNVQFLYRKPGEPLRIGWAPTGEMIAPSREHFSATTAATKSMLDYSALLAAFADAVATH